MVRPMRPFTTRCNDCGWNHTVIPNSDVLRYEDCPGVCPRCGSEAVRMDQATAWEIAVAKLMRLLC